MSKTMYVGVNDHKVDLFEGQYKVPDGMSYNSYVIVDEKVAVFDTVDGGFVDEWLANVEAALDGRTPDYLVVHHMEPDHSAGIAAFMSKYPTTTIVGNKKTFEFMEHFYPSTAEEAHLVVADGQTLSLGEHNLTFVFAPMVHWPEVMLSYDAFDGTLYSADAFGKFGAITDGEVADKNTWTDEARRYYIGIVGKYGMQVQALLKKAVNLDIKRICPLHGPTIVDDIGYFVGKYSVWSSYEPEEEGVCVCYTSVYGNTRAAAEQLAQKLAADGVKTAVYDLARCDMSQAVADAFRYNRLVLATTTYNNDIFPFMRTFVQTLVEHNFQRRTVTVIENGSWAPQVDRIVKGMLANSKQITYTTGLTILSRMSAQNLSELDGVIGEIENRA